MSVNFRIRPVRGEDVPAILRLWKEMMAFHQQRDAFFTLAENGEEQFSQFIQARLEDAQACVRIAEVKGQCVGYCLALVGDYPPVFKIRHYGEIMDLAVEAPHRRQGVGEALVQDMLGWFKMRGLKRWEARVAATNEISLSFWRKMGFSASMQIMAREA